MLYGFVTCLLKCLCLLQKHGTTSKPLKPVRLDSEVKIKLFNYIIIKSFLLLVEHRASMKSFQALRSPAIPLTSFHDLLVLLISSSIVLRHVLFGLPLLLYPRGFQSNAVFSVPPVFYVMCAQSNSILFFLSHFLLTSDG